MAIHRRYLLLAGLLAAVFATAVLGAQEVGEVILKRGVVAEDLYLAGRTVDVQAQLQGDLVAAGQRITVGDTVTGDVIAAGETVTLRGDVEDDARLAGRAVTVAGTIGDHVVAAGETVIVEAGATIGGWAWLAGREIDVAGQVGKELRAAGQIVIISGVVAGDVDILAEDIRILETAEIKGNLIYRSENAPEIAAGATIGGDVIEKPLPYAEWERDEAPVGGGILFLLMLAVAAMVYFLVFPRFSPAAAQTVGRSPLLSLALGVAVLFATPFVVLLLLVTVLGVLIALPLLAWYLLTLLGGFLTGVLYVGDVGLRLLGKAESGGKGWRVLSILLALIVIVLVQIIPVLGGLAVFVLFVLGLGALHLQVWRRYSETGSQ